MIARMSYVMCDECGNAGPLADDAVEARQAARRDDAFARVEGRDLCRQCKPASPTSLPEPEKPAPPMSAAPSWLKPILPKSHLPEEGDHA